MRPSTFYPMKYKAEMCQQWQESAAAWHRWMPVIRAWMGPATELMLDLAGIHAGSRVLDVAAGDGDQSLLAARRAGPEGSVLATDLAPNMLAFAVQSAQEAGLRNFEARVMDGENLELGGLEFDAVICRLGLMFFPDVPQALAEMHRVLKPGGRAAFVVFTTLERNSFFSIPAAVIRRRAQLLPNDPQSFNLGERGVLEEALSRAGFREVETHHLPAPLRTASLAECIQLLQEAFVTLRQMMSGLDDTTRQGIWREIEHELSLYETPAGFSAPGEVLVGVGVKGPGGG